MQSYNTKTKQEYLTNTVSVKEYAYREDTNYPVRPYMEDAHFYVDNYFNDGQSGIFCILDGHGGSEVVEYVTKVLPQAFLKEIALWNPSNPLAYFEYIFRKVDDQLRLVGASEIGSTCCLALIKMDRMKRICYVANIGDTRAVMCQNGKALRISVDHKGTNEEEQMRIKSEGGTILRNRVMGQLAVTRAFGDLDLKQQGVSNKPDLKIIEITKDHRYMIIASDGLWDVIEDQVQEYIHYLIQQQKAIDITKDLQSIDQMTKVLLDYALKNGSKDNISILIILF